MLSFHGFQKIFFFWIFSIKERDPKNMDKYGAFSIRPLCIILYNAKFSDHLQGALRLRLIFYISCCRFDFSLRKVIQKISDHLQDAHRSSLETKYVAVLSLASWEIRSWLEFFTCSMFLVVVVVLLIFNFVYVMFMYH